MNGKRARNIRRLLNLKLPVKPDLRVLKQIEKYVYMPNAITGETEMVKVKRTTIANAAKYQYNSAKKQLKGHKVPDVRKQRLAQAAAAAEELAAPVVETVVEETVTE